MATPFSTPIVSPVLVGRDARVAALRQCVDHLVRGSGQAVLIAGEAGIGKWRLDLLHTFLLHRPAEAESALGEIAPELIGLMPEMGRRFPRVAPHTPR